MVCVHEQAKLRDLRDEMDLMRLQHDEAMRQKREEMEVGSCMGNRDLAMQLTSLGVAGHAE